jgi:hypothetical protein
MPPGLTRIKRGEAAQVFGTEGEIASDRRRVAIDEFHIDGEFCCAGTWDVEKGGAGKVVRQVSDSFGKTR